MMRSAPGIALLIGASLLLTGCAGLFGSFGPARQAWRGAAEKQCLASGRVKVSAYVQPMSEMDGPGNCGADNPFRVSGALDGQVGIRPTATINCPMTAALDDWLYNVVEPAAMQTHGQPVVEVKLLSSYSCRRINGAASGSMSEHAYMNALDVGGFKFADGKDISVKNGWRSQDLATVTFLQEVGDRSCLIFNTVIGPDGDIHHQDHFHIDLANRRSGKYCKGGPVRGGTGLMSYMGGDKSFFRNSPFFGALADKPLPGHDPNHDD
ncbi:extensin [Prosthecomicrobium hirschii]|nr:extensin [Prosthecomicrobium hirschii]